MINLPWLENSHDVFPDVSKALAEPNGLLCASMHLKTDVVIDAYRHGIFPWYSNDEPVLWWSPNPRCILYPNKFHVSRSFRRTLNNNPFEIRINSSFSTVMLACAAPRAEPGEANSDTWITPAMYNVYCELHERGIAHSIECWEHEHLVGGIYGIILGDIFFGESMFSRKKDASKVAMHYLCNKIQPYIIDAQVESEHLKSLGAELISRSLFTKTIELRLLRELKIGK